MEEARAGSLDAERRVRYPADDDFVSRAGVLRHWKKEDGGGDHFSQSRELSVEDEGTCTPRRCTPEGAASRGPRSPLCF